MGALTWLRPDRALRIQALYYLVTGLAPVAWYSGFEWLTGPKRDHWLVKMVGLLTAGIGATLWAGRDAPTGPIRLLGATSAAAFMIIDVWYAAVRRRIRPVYLLDAVVESAFLLAWLRPTDEDPPGG